MKNLVSKLSTTLVMLLFCMLPLANAGSGGGSGGGTGGGGFCQGCSVSSDNTLNTGRCVACPSGLGDACIIDGMGFGDPVCKP